MSTPTSSTVPKYRASDSNWAKQTQRNARPSSESVQPSTSFATPETEAIDRWFEDLQHYEATLEDMAAASLDANFKEELSAIEQWFRVLSESERTAALYSLLQSSTQVQMRFFVTVLQQMARSDPTAALLSPANPGQASMEAQMEAKLAAMGLKGPASPAIRQYARQSLGPAGDSYLSPHSASALSTSTTIPSPIASPGLVEDPAAATLAAQRAKLKQNSRISAPANILLGASGGHDSALKSPMRWSEREQVSEGRSSSPSGSGNGIGRPKSTGSAGDSGNPYAPNSLSAGQHLSQSTGPPVTTSSYLRSPAVNSSIKSNTYDENQMSPIIGGSWASMTNTPLVPMFGNKNGDDGMAPGDYGAMASPNLDGVSARLGNWTGNGNGNGAGIVLDDVRKFRRSARVSSSGLPGGALAGMYEEPTQQQRKASPQLNSAQQNAINLGLGGLQQQQSYNNNSQSRNGASSPGLLSAQQSAITAQQNWRNGLGSPNPLTAGGDQADIFTQQLNAFGLNSALQNTGNLSANAQLANLFALQQQMMQQQQQMQQLGMAAAAAGMTLSPNQQALLSPGGRMNMGGMSPMGMLSPMGSNMGQSRRSPRSNDRSPGGNKGSNTPTVPGSGSNPEEPVDMSLIGDIPAWLRSLRLHKYTPNFEGSNWKEMVMLDDAGLDAKGVNALGARRKLLKVFEVVRMKSGMALPGDGESSNEPIEE